MSVRLQDQTSKPILLQRGVRQGDVISPKLFTAALEDVFKVLDWRGLGINVNGEYITHLRFADDIVVMAETVEDLSTMLDDLSRASERVGLKMNMDKTKVMLNAHVTPTPIKIGDSTLEVVDDYVYLRKRSIVESDSAGQRSGSCAVSSRPIYRSVSRRKSMTSVCCQ